MKKIFHVPVTIGLLILVNFTMLSCNRSGPDNKTSKENSLKLPGHIIPQLGTWFWRGE